jgi:hypothetical protein
MPSQPRLANPPREAIVLSFGAEDVMPDEIGEWNAAEEGFQGEPVLFVRVVTGSEFLLDQALKRNVYSGCIVLDGANSNRSRFGLPPGFAGVVVDELGAIAGYSRGELDHDALRAVLNHTLHAGLLRSAPQVARTPGIRASGPGTKSVRIALARKDEARVLGAAGPAR